MNPYELAQSYVTALTGDPNTTVDFRCIHDRDKAVPAHVLRGTLAQMWETLQNYNQAGYGIFCTVNAMDGTGQHNNNVTFIRSHVVDLDDPVTAPANYDRAAQSHPAPTFAVQTSPGKFHIYWCVEPYTSNEFYTLHQRKLSQLYEGDKSIIDAARVLRVPGFYHLKGEPFLVTCWGLSNQRTTAHIIEHALSQINVHDFISSRSPLGAPEMAAPDLQWLRLALSHLDPNDMDRGEWLSTSAAIKQAGWNTTDEATLLAVWLEWCAQFSGNDPGENMKLWNSIKDTEVGWTSLKRKTPIAAYETFGFPDKIPTREAAPVPQDNVPAGFVAPPPPEPVFGEILSEFECAQYFKDCYFINRTGEIFSKAGRFMNSTKFNGLYGGKIFIITRNGKATDEAWKAALRSTVYTIPKVDHVRFVPDQPLFKIMEDKMGRKGLNTYIPARIDARQGDVMPWLDWMDRILPDKNDQRLYMEYLAHCVKYPGYKIPWAPMLQSTEGIGKSIFAEVMSHCLGDMYVYSPKAPELVKSGSTFNAWMRGKLLILVNEIKIDERRELIEILKPMITDNRVEIQSKGVDQDMEDNPANWLFFSNYKDAIPVNQNGRRYAIFYSALQSKADLQAAGMNDQYFNHLWGWLREGGGLEAIAYWLLNYPIEKGKISVRAPETSSHAEALRITRSPMEAVIADCVDDGLPGFRGGYISTLAVMNRVKIAGIRHPSIRAVQSCLEGMGYAEIGRSSTAYFQEDLNVRPVLFGVLSTLDPNLYGKAQGYE